MFKVIEVEGGFTAAREVAAQVRKVVGTKQVPHPSRGGQKIWHKVYKLVPGGTKLEPVEGLKVWKTVKGVEGWIAKQV